MKIVHAIVLGMGLLILVYLGVKNGPAVVSIFNAGTSGTGTIITDLQGR